MTPPRPENVTPKSKLNAIQTKVDNTAARNNKPGNVSTLTANTIGGAIYIQTQLNAGHPVMVGVEETKTNGDIPNPKNRNALTGHFVVIRSSNVDDATGIITFNYMDNAKASTGKSSNNNFLLNTTTGSLKDTTTPGGRNDYSSYEMTEVR
jgi:hypothetical protein